MVLLVLSLFIIKWTLVTESCFFRESSSIPHKFWIRHCCLLQFGGGIRGRPICLSFLRSHITVIDLQLTTYVEKALVIRCFGNLKWQFISIDLIVDIEKWRSLCLFSIFLLNGRWVIQIWFLCGSFDFLKKWLPCAGTVSQT